MIPPDFITKFPDEFVLECKILLSDSEFNFWFDENEDLSGVGYCSRSLIEFSRSWMIPKSHVLARQKSNFFLNFGGEEYMKIYRSDYRDYYLNGYGTLDPSILSHDVLERLKKGKTF